MSIQIKRISAADLRGMEGQEGLILQGCGGDLQEWVDGINQELTEAGILLNDARLENVSTFQHEDVTCLQNYESPIFNLLKPYECRVYLWEEA